MWLLFLPQKWRKDMQILMISGKSGHGKDTFSTLLKEQLELLNKKVLIIHFGDPVKDALTRYYNWDGKKDMDGRALLQYLGTEVMRNKFPTYWADIIAKFLAATAAERDYAIIADWRFINEFETICQYNNDVKTIRINRFDNNDKPYYNNTMRLSQLTHISECELDDFNFEYIIENHDTIDTLKDSAITLIKEINK